MLRLLLLVFVITPIIEMWLLITVGSAIGAFPTIGLVLLTASIGLGLLRSQGMNTLTSARQKLAANEIPVREVADSLFYAVGGALLLTPGFVTDAVGFACLTPGIRTVIIQWLINNMMRSNRFQIRMAGFQRDNRKKTTGHIIDGDFKRNSDGF